MGKVAPLPDGPEMRAALEPQPSNDCIMERAEFWLGQIDLIAVMERNNHLTKAEAMDQVVAVIKRMRAHDNRKFERLQ